MIAYANGLPIQRDLSRFNPGELDGFGYRRCNRSVSSSMMLSSSVRLSHQFEEGYVINVVTQVLMAVRGVFKSWAIPSSRECFQPLTPSARLRPPWLDPALLPARN